MKIVGKKKLHIFFDQLYVDNFIAGKSGSNTASGIHYIIYIFSFIITIISGTNCATGRAAVLRTNNLLSLNFSRTWHWMSEVVVVRLGQMRECPMKMCDV